MALCGGLVVVSFFVKVYKKNFYTEKTIPINNIKNGTNTNNQDISECPSRHIKFRIQVQNRIYNILTKNTNIKFGTRILCCPIHKVWISLFTFCITIINNQNIEIAKYINAGVHKSLRRLGKAIIYI